MSIVWSSYTSILGDIQLRVGVTWAPSALVVPLPRVYHLDCITGEGKGAGVRDAAGGAPRLPKHKWNDLYTIGRMGQLLETIKILEEWGNRLYYELTNWSWINCLCWESWINCDRAGQVKARVLSFGTRLVARLGCQSTQQMIKTWKKNGLIAIS